jgi:hypothetical protein
MVSGNFFCEYSFVQNFSRLPIEQVYRELADHVDSIRCRRRLLVATEFSGLKRKPGRFQSRNISQSEKRDLLQDDYPYPPQILTICSHRGFLPGRLFTSWKGKG